jgi:hypothetical protein
MTGRAAVRVAAAVDDPVHVLADRDDAGTPGVLTFLVAWGISSEGEIAGRPKR